MVYVISVCISLMTFYFLGGKAQEGLYLNENRLDFLDQRYPVQVTDYLKHYQDGGNILNFLGYGGYLIYKLSPEYKVYYDGRSNILYPIEFVKHNAELWADAKKVDDVVERYEIDYVLRENKPRYYALLNKVKDIELSFADDRFMLFTRVGEAQFPLVSTLMVFPNCWESDVFRDRFSLGDFGQEIQKEIELSEELFEDKGYTLKVALEFFKDYLASDDKEAFLNSFYFEEKHTNGIRRIALYIAMKEAGSGTVSKIFSSIGESDDYDLLLYSYYLAKNGYYDAAEQLTYAFYTLNEVGEIQPTYDQLGILWRIFKILKEHNKIQRIEPSYIEVVDTVLKEVHYPFDRELSFDFMCK